MAKSAKKIVVGANGEVFVAAIGATAPTDATTDLTGEWSEFGFVSENGVTIMPSQSTTPIKAWQSAYPVRKIITERGLEVDFICREFNPVTIPFAFGGGALIEVGGEEFIYTPPKPEESDQRALVVQWRDKRSSHVTAAYRLYIAAGQVTDLSQFSVSRTAPTELPVKYALNDEGADNPWTLFSNDVDAFEGGS